jgi:hypothetical protein
MVLRIKLVSNVTVSLIAAIFVEELRALSMVS